MKNGLITALLIFVLLVSACVKKYEPDETRSEVPTAYELELTKSYIPNGFKIQNSRRVDFAEPYIFVSYKDEVRSFVGMSVFQLQGNDIKKYYQVKPFFGELIQFGLSRQEDYWVSDVLVENSYICPVEFNLGDDDNFVKIFTVNESGFGEIDIELEPWTVIHDIFEEQGEQIIRVFDKRFLNFSTLMHNAAPSRFLFFGSRDGKFDDVSKEHMNYIRQQVHNAMFAYNSTKEGIYQGQYRIGYGIEAYLYAEVGGVASEYIDEIRDMLDPVAFKSDDVSLAAEARNLINTAYEKKVPVASLRGFDNGFGDDHRWEKIKFDEFEVIK